MASPLLQNRQSFLGKSRAVARVLRLVRQVARTDVPVLITGESGTGKEVIAELIHANSGRADAPFIPVNTGAIARELIGSELFGHEKGAFTGADRQVLGKFELASGGTLFLDELSTMDEATQVSLLRVLESGRLQRIGGQDFVSVDTRIIGASNADLGSLIEEGAFREDLYYRLNVFSIHLPRLADRAGDVNVLARHFLDALCAQHGRDVKLDTEVMKQLVAYDWPGNVRELRNIIERLVLTCDGQVRPADLPTELGAGAGPRRRFEVEVGMTFDEVERLMLINTLATVEGNRQTAARMLGISRKTLYNRIKKHGLE